MSLAEAAEHEPQSMLIVTTKSAISVWEDHVKALMPGTTVFTVSGQVTDETLQEWADSEPFAVITNWAQVRLRPKLQKVKWDHVIADEAQALKNRKTKQTRALKKIKATRKRALTGTPIINRPDDLWSLLNWLEPRRFTGYWDFFEEFVEYNEHNEGACRVPTCRDEWGNQKWHQTKFREIVGPRNVPRLKKLLEPLYIRRVKKDVMPELPDKYYSVVKVTLPPKQRRIYNEMRKEALAWVGKGEDEPVPAAVAIAKLTRLRQFTAAYADVEWGTDDFGHRFPEKVTLSEPSAKLDALMDILDSRNGEPVVIFSQFAQMVELACRRFTDAGITYSKITGAVTGTARRDAIEYFQQGKTSVFISTIQAGGAGITLTRSSTVVFLDRSWSPADNWQAEDRLHRHGQTNAVHVIDIQARDTVDQVIESKLELKKSWIREILGGAG